MVLRANKKTQIQEIQKQTQNTITNGVAYKSLWQWSQFQKQVGWWVNYIFAGW